MYTKRLQEEVWSPDRGVFICASWHDDSCVDDCFTTALFVSKQAHDVPQDVRYLECVQISTSIGALRDNSDIFEILKLNNLTDKLRCKLRQADSELREYLISVFCVANHINPARIHHTIVARTAKTKFGHPLVSILHFFKYVLTSV